MTCGHETLLYVSEVLYEDRRTFTVTDRGDIVVSDPIDEAILDVLTTTFRCRDCDAEIPAIDVPGLAEYWEEAT